MKHYLTFAHVLATLFCT